VENSVGVAFKNDISLTARDEFIYSQTMSPQKIRHLETQPNAGFTLVELVVSIAIFAVFVFAVTLSFNPKWQLDKARDSQRKQDLTQIRSALDSYYNDFNCYPASVPFGQEWSSGNVIYMKKVPQDPECPRTGYCYIYQTEETVSCPQWNILYTHLVRPTKQLCIARESCLTRNPPVRISMSTKYNFCILSGDIDCQYLADNPFPTPIVPTSTPVPPTSTPAPTSTPGPTPTPGGPSPTPGNPCGPGDPNSPYACSTGNCNTFRDRQPECTWNGGPTQCYCTSNCDGVNCSGAP